MESKTLTNNRKFAKALASQSLAYLSEIKKSIKNRLSQDVPLNREIFKESDITVSDIVIAEEYTEIMSEHLTKYENYLDKFVSIINQKATKIDSADLTELEEITSVITALL